MLYQSLIGSGGSLLLSLATETGRPTHWTLALVPVHPLPGRPRRRFQLPPERQAAADLSAERARHRGADHADLGRAGGRRHRPRGTLSGARALHTPRRRGHRPPRGSLGGLGRTGGSAGAWVTTEPWLVPACWRFSSLLPPSPRRSSSARNRRARSSRPPSKRWPARSTISSP